MQLPAPPNSRIFHHPPNNIPFHISYHSPSSPPPAPGNHKSTVCLRALAVLDTSSKWHPRLWGLCNLASFKEHQVFQAHLLQCVCCSARFQALHKFSYPLRSLLQLAFSSNAWFLRFFRGISPPPFELLYGIAVLFIEPKATFLLVTLGSQGILRETS